nr:NmrA family NAD(P)-binding protein [Marinicella sp. W31]MDC2878160.1 NmrA family NAD(P)-binding protein [Marinicella sp. W31]
MTESKSGNALTMQSLALVLGASGGVGGAVAKSLLQRGYRIRAMNRNPEKQAEKIPLMSGFRATPCRRRM